MNGFKTPNLILFFLVMMSCGKPVPKLEGIDQAAFANDKNACSGKRTEMIDAMTKEKEKLLALNEMEIVGILGRPDQNELYKRNQKFFYYFLKPSSNCGTKADSTASLLVIRFNAMGLAKEVSIE
jgi:hypothetical protein